MAKKPNIPPLFDGLPELIRQEDREFVQRPSAIEFQWDQAGVLWDQAGVSWDSVLGPEQILRTTMRAWQIELEDIAIDTERFTTLFDPDTCPVEFLPYILSLYGQPLNTDLQEVSQRAFVKNFSEFMRNKGTLISFEGMFRSLGFDPIITELYQSKIDAQIVKGLEVLPVSTNVIREVLGVGDGATTQFGPFYPENTTLIPNKVIIEAGTQTIIDDGLGALVGDIGGGTNTVEYDTGVINVDFADPVPLDVEVLVTYEYLFDAFPEDFTRTEKSDEGDGFADTFQYLAEFDRLTPGTIEITANGLTVTDDGAGNLVGDIGGGTNTIDYSTGAIDVTFSAIIPVDVPVYTKYEYEARFRSSFFDGFIVPTNPALPFTPQLTLRVLSLFFILKPIHSVPRKLALLLLFDDSLIPVDADPFEENMLINSGIETFNAGLFHGKPWAPDYNNEVDLVPQIRDGRQTDDRFPAALAQARTDTITTADVAPTTTNFSILDTTNLGTEDLVVFTSGPDQGLHGVITAYAPAGSFTDITVSPALQKVPGIGDSVTILRGTARMDWLLSSKKAFDELEVVQTPPGTVTALGEY